jgi:hypothetical protein
MANLAHQTFLPVRIAIMTARAFAAYTPVQSAFVAHAARLARKTQGGTFSGFLEMLPVLSAALLMLLAINSLA